MQDLFGKMCYIDTKLGHNTVYRIIKSGNIYSKTWCDVPIISDKPTAHSYPEEIVYVVLDETMYNNSNIIKVRLEDIKIF